MNSLGTQADRGEQSICLPVFNYPTKFVFARVCLGSTNATKQTKLENLHGLHGGLEKGGRYTVAEKS